MLYPRENRVRGVIDLGGVWNFKLGDEKEPGDSFAMGEDTELMAVPASYNDQKDDPKYRNHYGWAYYERKITVPSYLKGQRLVLRFDAVTHAAKVYLNGRFLTAHKGGFLPFEVEVTDQLVPGETAELVVAADNRVNHSTLPVGNEGSTAFFGSDNPGVPSVEAAKVWRKPQNLPNFDFFNYAGINRPVRIYTTPAAYIEDITLVPDIDGDTGVVNYEIKTAGSVCEDEVRIRILDADGNEVAAADGAGGTVRIPDAKMCIRDSHKGARRKDPCLHERRISCGDVSAGGGGAREGKGHAGRGQGVKRKGHAGRGQGVRRKAMPEEGRE